MEDVRKIVSEALKLRADAGVKVRQPLARLEIKNKESRIKIKALLDLIKDEVNVKEITFGGELKLDTEITAELKEEGIVREVIRNIQEMRKDLGLHPKDKIRVQFSTRTVGTELFFRGKPESLSDFDSILGKWRKAIIHEAGVKEFVIGGKKQFRVERELEFDGRELWIGIGI